MVRRSERSPDNAMLIEIVKVLQDEPRYAVAARRIDAIERRYLPTVAKVERLGLQRSAARMAFIAATDKGASFATVSKRFRAICAHGFENELTELPVLVEFGFSCAEFGKRQAGLRVLAVAQDRLGGSRRKPHCAFVQQMSRLIEKCRRDLEGGEAGRTHSVLSVRPRRARRQ